MRRVWLVVLIALVTSACGLFSRPTPTPVPVEIRFAYYARELTPHYERLKVGFEQTNPHLSIKLLAMNPYEMLFRGPGSADVVEINQLAVASLAAQGTLRPLDPVVREAEGVDLEAFYPGTVDALRWEGQLWALPLGVDPALLYYNKAIFEAKGVPYPTNDWTWGDLLEAALRIAEPDADPPLYGLVSDIRRADFLPLLYQAGGGIAGNPLEPERAAFSSEASVAAMQWYVDLALVHRVMPIPQDLTAIGGMEGAVVSQRAAMWYGGLSERGGFAWSVPWKFEWGVVAQPAGSRRTTILSIRACAINQQSEHAREAWEWLKYLVEHPPTGYDVPALATVDLGAHLAGGGPEVVLAVRLSLRDGQALPAIVWRPQFFYSLDRSFRWVFSGDHTVEEAMAELDRSLNEALSGEQ